MSIAHRTVQPISYTGPKGTLLVGRKNFPKLAAVWDLAAVEGGSAPIYMPSPKLYQRAAQRRLQCAKGLMLSYWQVNSRGDCCESMKTTDLYSMVPLQCIRLGFLIRIDHGSFKLRHIVRNVPKKTRAPTDNLSTVISGLSIYGMHYVPVVTSACPGRHQPTTELTAGNSMEQLKAQITPTLSSPLRASRNQPSHGYVYFWRVKLRDPVNLNITAIHGGSK
jgi:hypothetical protein